MNHLAHTWSSRISRWEEDKKRRPMKNNREVYPPPNLTQLSRVGLECRSHHIRRLSPYADVGNTARSSRKKYGMNFGN